MVGGVWNGLNPSQAGNLPGPKDSHFEDFLGGLAGVGPIGKGYFRFAIANNGYGNGLTAGSGGLGVLGRLGILEIGTGTINNINGQAFLANDSCAMYPGQAGFVMQWGARMPAALSDATNEYVLEMGLGFYPYTGVNAGAVISYKRTTSTNFICYTADGTTKNSVVSSNNIAVTAGAWYNFMIVLNSAGTLISFYVGSPGAAYVLLGTSALNLPNITNQCNPYFNIYRTATFALNRVLGIDWWQLNITGLNRS